MTQPFITTIFMHEIKHSVEEIRKNLGMNIIASECVRGNWKIAIMSWTLITFKCKGIHVKENKILITSHDVTLRGEA